VEAPLAPRMRRCPCASKRVHKIVRAMDRAMNVRRAIQNFCASRSVGSQFNTWVFAPPYTGPPTVAPLAASINVFGIAIGPSEIGHNSGAIVRADRVPTRACIATPDEGLRDPLALHHHRGDAGRSKTRRNRAARQPSQCLSGNSDGSRVKRVSGGGLTRSLVRSSSRSSRSGLGGVTCPASFPSFACC
jgi:hypothetical protein